MPSESTRFPTGTDITLLITCRTLGETFILLVFTTTVSGLWQPVLAQSRDVPLDVVIICTLYPRRHDIASRRSPLWYIGTMRSVFVEAPTVLVPVVVFLCIGITTVLILVYLYAWVTVLKPCMLAMLLRTMRNGPPLPLQRAGTTLLTRRHLTDETHVIMFRRPPRASPPSPLNGICRIGIRKVCTPLISLPSRLLFTLWWTKTPLTLPFVLTVLTMVWTLNTTPPLPTRPTLAPATPPFRKSINPQLTL